MRSVREIVMCWSPCLLRQWWSRPVGVSSRLSPDSNLRPVPGPRLRAQLALDAIGTSSKTAEGQTCSRRTRREAVSSLSSARMRGTAARFHSGNGQAAAPSARPFSHDGPVPGAIEQPSRASAPTDAAPGRVFASPRPLKVTGGLSLRGACRAALPGAPCCPSRQPPGPRLVSRSLRCGHPTPGVIVPGTGNGNGNNVA